MSVSMVTTPLCLLLLAIIPADVIAHPMLFSHEKANHAAAPPKNVNLPVNNGQARLSASGRSAGLGTGRGFRVSASPPISVGLDGSIGYRSYNRDVNGYRDDRYVGPVGYGSTGVTGRQSGYGGYHGIGGIDGQVAVDGTSRQSGYGGYQGIDGIDGQIAVGGTGRQSSYGVGYGIDAGVPINRFSISSGLGSFDGYGESGASARSAYLDNYQYGGSPGQISNPTRYNSFR